MTTETQDTNQMPTVPVSGRTHQASAPARPIRVYIAARGEDQHMAKELRDDLNLAGIDCTARWIDLPLTNESHDEAEMDILDVRRADVLVLLKPAASHRKTTGGHHVETGIALAMGMPVALLGERENVFHHHDTITVLPFPKWDTDITELAMIIRGLAGSWLRGGE